MENEKLEPIGTIQMTPSKKLEQCEWCFQFDDDEPKVFAWTEEDMTDEDPTVTFTIGNTEGAYVSFTKDGKTFKLFARELTEEGKKLREFNNQNFVTNESKNKEA
jgi:hypothetical protein